MLTLASDDSLPPQQRSRSTRLTGLSASQIIQGESFDVATDDKGFADVFVGADAFTVAARDSHGGIAQQRLVNVTLIAFVVFVVGPNDLTFQLHKILAESGFYPMFIEVFTRLQRLS